MQTNLDYVKKEIAAGRYLLGASVKGPKGSRSWTPIGELPSQIALLSKRVDRIMRQQRSVDFLTCISSDFQQMGVLYVLPQQTDGVAVVSAKSKGSGNLLNGLRALVDEQLVDAARKVQSVISEFRSAKHPSVEQVSEELNSAINPAIAEQMLQQVRMDPADMKLTDDLIELGGQKDHIPEAVMASGLTIVEFIPTRGIDEKKSTARVEVVEWSDAPAFLTQTAEASFFLETCNDMQAVKALEAAQLHHKTVKCEVRAGRNVSSGRTSLTITRVLNLDELARPVESVQQLLFGT